MYHWKFQRVGTKCAKAGVQFSSKLIYVLQFSRTFKLQNEEHTRRRLWYLKDINAAAHSVDTGIS